MANTTKHGLLYEIDPNMTQDATYSALSITDVDGGGLVVTGDLNGDAFKVTPPSTTTKRVHIALNPTMKYTKIGDNIFTAMTDDDRDYTNLADNAFDIMEVVIGRLYEVIDTNIEGNTAPTKGDFLEVTNNKTTFSIKGTQTADVPSFEVIRVGKKLFPKESGIGDNFVPSYVLKCVSNG